jgi:hypothetical protein
LEEVFEGAVFAGDFAAGAFAAGLAATTFAATVLAGAILGTGFEATGFLATGLAGLEGAFFAAGLGAGFAGAFLATGAGFLTTLTFETGFALGATFFTAGFLTEAALTGLEGDFPEDFRTGEDLEFFFNGELVKPSTRARKDR